MGKRGPDPAILPDEILELMDNHPRPVWSVSRICEHADISRPTATDRLDSLVEDGRLETVQVGNTTAYYQPDEEEADVEEHHRQSIRDSFEDRFVGLPMAPWTAINPNDGPAEAGDKIQIQVDGRPGRWAEVMARPWEDRRDELTDGEVIPGSTQALVSGTLYARPTTPIQHEEIPRDYDLEAKTGARTVQRENATALIANGPKSYLIKPCNDAVFLTDVEVEWISPVGEGTEMESGELTEEDLEAVEEWREENLDVDPV